MSKGNKLIERENHIYHWMSWAIKDYSINQKLGDPNDAWNSDDELSLVPSKPGQGFFSPINRDYFYGTLKIENLSHDSDEGLNGSTITVTTEAMPNESYPKKISWKFKDRNGIIRDEQKRKTKGNRDRIGFNFYEQSFCPPLRSTGLSR